jgi:superfamily II helicase
MPCATSADGSITICRPPGAQPAAGAKMAIPGEKPGEMEEMDMGWKPGQLAWCRKCLRRRRLSSLMVTLQMYYDPSFFCADPRDCARAKTKRNAKRNATRRRRYAERKKERGAV